MAASRRAAAVGGPARPPASLAPVPSAESGALGGRRWGATSVPASPGRALSAAAGSSRAPPPSPPAVPLPSPLPWTSDPDLPAHFDPARDERALYTWWEASGAFRPEPGALEAAETGTRAVDEPEPGTGPGAVAGSSGSVLAPPRPFVMTMPPPNVTGRLHVGHAMFVAIQDAMARAARLEGRPTLWLPGSDHAGIATQLVVERELVREGDVTRESLGREAFLERVWSWKERYGGAIREQLRALGASADWSRERFTLDAGSSRAVTAAFCALHDRGLVYRGSYMVNWAPGLRTAVSDLEVEYSEEEGSMYVFRYPVEGGDESPGVGRDEGKANSPAPGSEGRGGSPAHRGRHLLVASTRPETLLGDTALAVHPQDPRFSSLVGSRAIVPLSGGRRIPIVADEAVDPEFGTGVLKITPGHDPADHAVGLRHGLPVVNLLGDDGRMLARDSAGNPNPYAGMASSEAREAVWADLEARGLAVSRTPHPMRVPRAQRGGEPIEPMVRDQWFVRAGPLAAKALEAFDEGRGTPKVVPERFGKIYQRWLVEIRDWCVSRQLWWGHRIPAWFLFSSEDEARRGPGPHQPYVVAADEREAARGAAKLLSAPAAGSGGAAEGEGGGEHAGSAAALEAFDEAALARLRTAAEAGTLTLRQDPDVLDTWFSSGLWPFSTLGWPDEDSLDLSRYYPTSVLETGHDILFFWVARMAMLGVELTGEIPFETVYLHGLVRDEAGRKMSKSLGNVVDPLEAAGEYGTDALRLALVASTTPGQDVNLSPTRMVAARNFTNKLWNVTRLARGSAYLSRDPAERALLRDLGDESRIARDRLPGAPARASLPLPDRWVLDRLDATVDAYLAALRRHDLGEAARLARDFVWNDLADWYLEASKERLKGAEGGLPGGTGRGDDDGSPPTRAEGSSDLAANRDEGSSDPVAAPGHASRATLLHALRRSLLLLHPFVPFVTEALWQAMPFSAARGDEALITSRWPAKWVEGAGRDARAPTPPARDGSAFETLAAIVRVARNARAEYGVDPKRRVPAEIFVTGDASLAAELEAELDTIARLAKLDAEKLRVVAGDRPAPEGEGAGGGRGGGAEGAVTLVVSQAVSVVVPLSGLFDPAKELRRLSKQCEKLAAELAKNEARLAAPGFREKAPARVVAEIAAAAEALRGKVAAVEAQMAQLSRSA